jgi:hypothetical protein
MRRQRFTAAQVIAKLREVDVLVGRGSTADAMQGRFTASRMKRLPDNKSRSSLKKNSTVSPALSMAREIHPLAAHLDVGFVDMSPAGDHALSPVEPLQQ